MNKSSVLIIIKQLTGLVGVAGVSALIGLPAQAQLKTATNNLHDVTEQWRVSNAETASPETIPQTQELPEDTPTVDAIPASGPESAADLIAPTADISDNDPSIAPIADIPADDPSVEPTADIPADDPSVEPTADTPADDPSVEPTADIPADDPSVAPTADIPADDPSIMAPAADISAENTSATEEIPTSDTGSATDLIAPTADTLNKENSEVEEIPTSDAGSAADLMESAPEAPEAVEMTETSSISPAELQQFANAVTEVQAIEQETQESMAQLITAEGLSPERFNQIFLAQQSANDDPAPEVTPEEQQTFDQVLSQLQAIDQASQTIKEEAVTAQGLEMERFSQILTAVRQDPGLQQQVQELLPLTE